MRELSHRFVLVLAGCMLATLLPAQQATPPKASSLIRVRTVSFEEMLTPDYAVSVRGSTKKDGRARWLCLKTDYETAPRWADEVTFTYYVMLKGDRDDLPRDAKSAFTMFSGSVTYVNVPEGRHESTMFLDPKTFARFGSPEAVAVEVSINGEKAGEVGEPKQMVASRWWADKTANAVSLLSRDESPWRLVEIESHETIRR